MSADEALIRIAAIWVLWAEHKIDEGEAMGRIAEALEQAGVPLIEG